MIKNYMYTLIHKMVWSELVNISVKSYLIISTCKLI